MLTIDVKQFINFIDFMYNSKRNPIKAVFIPRVHSIYKVDTVNWFYRPYWLVLSMNIKDMNINLSYCSTSIQSHEYKTGATSRCI